MLGRTGAVFLGKPGRFPITSFPYLLRVTDFFRFYLSVVQMLVDLFDSLSWGQRVESAVLLNSQHTVIAFNVHLSCLPPFYSPCP